MSDDIPTIDELLELYPMLDGGNISLEMILSAHPNLVEELKKFDPIKSASIFSAFLTEPHLQSNCYRLETLVHLTLAIGDGAQTPSHKDIIQWFSVLEDGPCGYMEDPAEDMFVTLVSTPKGNFRILEGIWESASFYLQRVLNAVEGMPDEYFYDQIRISIYSLLQLSDLVCERAKLQRYQLGNSIPAEELPINAFKNINSYQHRITFSLSELEIAGIDLDSLDVFGFLPIDRRTLLNETVGHTLLERHPIAFNDSQLFVLLPTAVSAAIRRFVIEQMNKFNMREAFLYGLADEYSNCFTINPLLGNHSNVSMEFYKTKNGIFSGIMKQVDIGRYINIIFFIDILDGFEKSGLCGLNPDSKLLVEDFDEEISYFLDKIRKKSGFKECLTLMVGCGVGRGLNYVVNNKKREKWNLIFISAADLYCLGWVSNFDALSLFRINDAQDKLEEMGTTLFNINGVLNLVAWIRSLKGHLVPHGELPIDFGQGNSMIVVEQNKLRNLRHEVYSNLDSLRIINIHGQFVNVKRINNDSLFYEDKGILLYGGEYFVPGKGIPIVYISSKRPWWLEVCFNENVSSGYKYDHWKMLSIWLSRSASILDSVLTELSDGPVLWKVNFKGDADAIKINAELVQLKTGLNAITIQVECSQSTVYMTVDKEFEQAIFHSDNIAERALVIRLVDGFIELSGNIISSDKRHSIVNRIIPDNVARQSHAFQARSFRDYVRESIPKHPVFINNLDEACLKLGLGWKEHDISQGSEIHGKEQCMKYLNSIVVRLEDEICSELKKYDRYELILLALKNHESASVNREWWRKTSGAVIALRKDKIAARKVIIDHELELNTIFQASRLIIELAICECPEKEGEVIGELDFSRLMAKIMLVVNFGGCSDAIRWDAMEPIIVITPLGDIHLNFDFFDNVIAPFGKVGVEETIESSISKYSINLEEPKIRSNVEGLIEKEFFDAWEAEIGVTINEMRQFVDYIEDQGIKENSATLIRPKNMFFPKGIDNVAISENAATIIIDLMTLNHRSSWRVVPDGFDKKDIQLWRFKRRLTVLRKPFIQINNEDNPTLIVSPGLLRDAFSYMFDNYYRGSFPGWQFHSQEMSSWVGKYMHKRGNDFSKVVANRFSELGWNVEVELPVTKLLRKGFDMNYGDVDVLAWNDSLKRVLLIECKNVQYRKTPGEIAEQLSDFRGEIKENGKPDFLKKHLDRIDLIFEHADEVSTYIGTTKQYKIEGHLVFKNPVPMQYAWEHMINVCPISIHSNLDEFFISKKIN